jgi:hypothetical protein
MRLAKKVTVSVIICADFLRAIMTLLPSKTDPRRNRFAFERQVVSE